MDSHPHHRSSSGACLLGAQPPPARSCLALPSPPGVPAPFTQECWAMKGSGPQSVFVGRKKDRRREGRKERREWCKSDFVPGLSSHGSGAPWSKGGWRRGYPKASLSGETRSPRQAALWAEGQVRRSSPDTNHRGWQALLPEPAAIWPGQRGRPRPWLSFSLGSLPRCSPASLSSIPCHGLGLGKGWTGWHGVLGRCGQIGAQG